MSTTTVNDFADKYGVPKGWAVAAAIEQQIQSFRDATRTLIRGPQATKLTAFSDPGMIEARIEAAAERVARPVVDFEEAKIAARGIEESGGWGRYVWQPTESE